MIKELSILGFRGFGEKQTIEFALPDGKNDGSGLSIITGSNNSGKTTIVEAIRAFNGRTEPTFSEGRRNLQNGGKVELSLLDSDDKECRICSDPMGGSSTIRSGDIKKNKYYVLQSRRYVNYEFGRALVDRDYYIEEEMSIKPQRTANLELFNNRLFQIEKNRDGFDCLLKRMLGEGFQWAIEQRDSGFYYIIYTYGGVSHSAEGIGDGIWSLFTICAALYDADDKTTLVIDEPELSLHPALQKKLNKVLVEYAKKFQIIICTHSPYFVDWEAISHGAHFIRVIKEGVNSKCYQLHDDCRRVIKGALSNINNPHILGIESSELFFLDDGVILVEGQEDVVILNRISEEIGISFRGSFFGWGAGGAERIQLFLELFRDLGYKKVVAIFDGDKKTEADKARSLFPQYHIITLRTDDVRDKKSREIKEKQGITDEKGTIKREYYEYASDLIKEVNQNLI